LAPQAIAIQFDKIIVLQSVTAQWLCQLRDHDIVFYYLVAAYAQNAKMERISMVACRRVAQDILPFIEIKNSLEDVAKLVFVHARAGRR
jgi:hypothetical protein